MKKYLLFLIIVVILSLWSGQDRKWQQLFNGKDLSGWEQIGPGEFVVEDGFLKTVGGMGMILYSAEKFSDVVIRVVYKVKDNDCNSGVFIRLPEKPSDEWEAVNTGYEVQIDSKIMILNPQFILRNLQLNLYNKNGIPFRVHFLSDNHS